MIHDRVERHALRGEHEIQVPHERQVARRAALVSERGDPLVAKVVLGFGGVLDGAGRRPLRRVTGQRDLGEVRPPGIGRFVFGSKLAIVAGFDP